MTSLNKIISRRIALKRCYNARFASPYIDHPTANCVAQNWTNWHECLTSYNLGINQCIVSLQMTNIDLQWACYSRTNLEDHCHPQICRLVCSDGCVVRILDMESFRAAWLQWRNTREVQWHSTVELVFAPAGFWPLGQNPRRHPRIPRVYTYKEFQNVR